MPALALTMFSLLDKEPDSIMCASSRMVVRRRGANHPVVLACTLLSYDQRFELGSSLAEAQGGRLEPRTLRPFLCARRGLLYRLISTSGD